MPGGHVLTEASTMTCAPGHPASPLGPGQIQIPASTRLTVLGHGVLRMPVGAVGVKDCGQQVTAAPTKPCTTAAVTGGATGRLVVDGVQVLLAETFTATTDGLPIAVHLVTANQGLLRVSEA